MIKAFLQFGKYINVFLIELSNSFCSLMANCEARKYEIA